MVQVDPPLGDRHLPTESIPVGFGSVVRFGHRIYLRDAEGRGRTTITALKLLPVQTLKHRAGNRLSETGGNQRVFSDNEQHHFAGIILNDSTVVGPYLPLIRLLMMKAMCISGIVFGLLAVVVFALDLALTIPFGRPSTTMDIGFIVSGLIICYLGWSAKKQLN